MPVTVSANYRNYSELLREGQLDLSSTRCSGLACVAAGGGCPLVLTGSRVDRPLVALVRDGFGELTTVVVVLGLALASCSDCGRRVRVLPEDVLPYKRYSLPVIEEMVSEYRDGGLCLRLTVARLLGEQTPAHNSLHGWSEGLGAFAKGQPTGELPGALPASACVVEAENRVPGVREARSKPVLVSPARYRSEERQERLEAGYVLLAVAEVTGEWPGTGADELASRPDCLSKLNRLVVTWVHGQMSGLGFRAVLGCTPFEHVPSIVSGCCRCRRREERRTWPTHTTSPPGATSR